MRFRLIYQGPLSGSGNSSKKAAEVRRIRDHLHPQLEYLWQTHTALKRLRGTAIVKSSGGPHYATKDNPFNPGRDWENHPAREDEIDLAGPIFDGERGYIPLVRKSLDLNCSLEILFLRHEDPGALVLQGGDIDNRIKTLFDALRKPELSVATQHPQGFNPLYCLLESDTLISGFDVDTDRLLTPPTNGRQNEVHLVIEVSIRVLRLGSWNISLLCE